MVKRDRRAVVIGLAGLLLASVLYLWTGRGGGQGILGPPDPTRSASPTEDLPRIDLARLQEPRDETEAGKARNIFDFGERRERGGAPATPQPPPPTLAMATPLPQPSPTPPTVPPMNVKYVGTVESKKGLRVAILLTDKQEILTGQAGELVANRFRILKIGYESVDIQDVGSESVRRIPFRGN